MPDRSPLKRIFAPLIVALSVLLILFAAIAWMPLRRARAEWRAGRLAEAVAEAESWSRTRMWPNQYEQILAIAFLSAGRFDAAKPHLDALQGRSLWLSLVTKQEVANHLFARGEYAQYLDYDAAVRERNESADDSLYRAAALTATDRFADATNALRTINRGAVDPQKLAALDRALTQRQSGQWPYVLDRDGKTIATHGSQLKVVDRDYAAFIDGDGQLTIASQINRLGGDATIETTFDSAVARAAMAALKNYHGSLVAIDPRTNEILAIVSNDKKNLALEKQYEPGSIIKVLTALNAVNSGMNVPSMFPYHCSGDLMIDGRHFGDWVPQGHGTLPDLNEALAQSCNVFFADVGLRLGLDRLRHFMTSAGFDAQTNLGLFVVPLGRTRGEIFNKFETAFYAIGLEHETITTLHIAMLASMLANRGVLTPPRVLRARRSILGEAVVGPSAEAHAPLASREASETIVQAMVAVVTHPKGTGRRAEMKDIPLALKTGTAGLRENGYNAQIIAFAPVTSPKIAFGIIAENAGPAEYAAAKIARDFLDGIRDRLEDNHRNVQ